MSGLWDLNIIHLFDFYLLMVFFIGMARRARQYWDTAGLVLKGPGRWPLLFKLVKQHRTIFLTWGTIVPGLAALTLSMAQLFASWTLWPAADLTVGRLAEHGLAAIMVLVVGVAMLATDVYGIVVVAKVDREQMDKYFDQAEYWLRSKTAHVVRVFTLGFVNPRQMVATEVKKALLEVSRQLNYTLWWVSMQLGLRIAFGLTIWFTWGALPHHP
jgi:hypothetical protein